MINLAPVILFTYLKIDPLRKTVQSLSDNFLATDTNLIIFSDGPKNINEVDRINEIRTYLKSIEGFNSVIIHEFSYNLGLSNSIIQNVTEVFKSYPSAIILEDDIITSKNFLSFMNQALNFYQNDSKILSISGYSPSIKGLETNEVYFTQRSSSWGWACWADRWSSIDWGCSQYEDFKYNRKLKKQFNRMGSDMSYMLKKQMQGYLDSWAIRFCFHQFNNNLFSVVPAISKTSNIGFNDINATNTINQFNRFKTILDNSNNEIYNFKSNITLEYKIIKKFRRNNSLFVRFIFKIISFLFES